MVVSPDHVDKAWGRGESALVAIVAGDGLVQVEV